MSNIIVEPTQVIVVQQPQSTVSVQGNGAVNVTQQNQTRVQVQPGAIQIVEIAQQGPPGPPGSGSTIQAMCGASISQGIACVLIDGLLYPADPTNPAHAPFYVGVSTEAGGIDNTINVAQLGDITLSDLTSGSRYYIGLNGVLTNSPAPVGATWLRYVGTAESETVLVLISSVSILLG